MDTFQAVQASMGHLDVQPSERAEKRETAPISRHILKNLLTGPKASVSVGVMSQCSSARFDTQPTRISPAGQLLLDARPIAILVLVLVLLITNGGAG